MSEESKEKITTDVYFRGIAGRLEGKYTQNKDSTSPSVLLLPPDPRYGGTLDNAVIVAIEKVFRDCGFTTLRINYRGIHRSDGVFSGPEDAIYDAATALDWLQEQNPESSHFWLVGYSFGAWVDANIMMRRPEIETFVLVSPIVDKYDLISEEDVVFSDILPAISKIGYGSNNSILKDHIVRAITLRYLLNYKQDISYYNNQYNLDKELGFKYIDSFLEELLFYENNRTIYPDFETFYPELINSVKKSILK